MSGFGGDLLAAVCGGGVASRSHSLLHVAEIPARGGEPVGWPDWVHPDLLGALAGRGIAAPWSHQVEAADLVSHDLTPHSRAMLRTGVVDVVINQNAGHIARSAMRVLKAHCDGVEVIASQERIRIEIVLKENLPQDGEGEEKR